MAWTVQAAARRAQARGLGGASDEEDGIDGSGQGGAYRLRALEGRDRAMESPESFPPPVCEFLQKLYIAVENRNEGILDELYDVLFPRVSQAHYSRSRWCSPQAVERFYREQFPNSPQCRALVMLFYRELYYRHLHTLSPDTNAKVTLEEREGSWNAYLELFEYFRKECMAPPHSVRHSAIASPQQQNYARYQSSGGGGPQLSLPLLWTFEMLDEFLYQWGQFKTWHSKLTKTRLDKAMVKGQTVDMRADNDLRLKEMRDIHDKEVWSTDVVLRELHLLVLHSGINEYFQARKNNPPTRMVEDRLELELGLQIGYVACIQLMRLHCLMGNYYFALDQLHHFSFTGEALFYRVANCHLSLYYYMGFCYLMLRRYHDAVKTFTNVLTFLDTKQEDYLQGSQEGHLRKMKDRMYQLVLVCTCLQPEKTDDNISNYIRQNHSERANRLMRDEEEEFRLVFRECAPKFVSPGPPPFSAEDPAAESYDPMDLASIQMEIFMEETRHQKLVPTIRSYARLYTSIPVAKLAALLNATESQIFNFLLCVKHKSRQLQWQSGPPLSGDIVSSDDSVDFYLTKDVLHVRSSKNVESFATTFLREMKKFGDVARAQERIVPPLIRKLTPQVKGSGAAGTMHTSPQLPSAGAGGGIGNSSSPYQPNRLLGASSVAPRPSLPSQTQGMPAHSVPTRG